MTSSRSPQAALLLVLGAALVVLGEVPRIVEADNLAWLVPVDAVVRSSTLGGTIVLACVGFTASRELLEARADGRVAAVAALVGIVLPVAAVQVLVLAASSVARAVDSLATGAPITGDAWLNVLTFRWNTWVTDHIMTVPAELLGLALLSIVVQLLALLAAVIAVLPRRWSDVVLGMGALMAALVVIVLRWQALDFQDPYVLTLDTFARSDAFFLGVAAACAVRLGRHSGPAWSSAAWCALVGVVLATSFVSTEQHIALQLPLGALLACIALLDDGSEPGDWLLEPLIRSREVDLVAAVWVPLVASATPAAAIIGRRTEMNWVLRVVVLAVVLAVVVRIARVVLAHVRLPARTMRLGHVGTLVRSIVADADARIQDQETPRRRPAETTNAEVDQMEKDPDAGPGRGPASGPAAGEPPRRSS